MYVETTGDNMTGDLTLGTDKITLDAVTGSATFSGGIVGKGAGPAYAFEITDGTTNMGGLYRDAEGANLYLKNSSGVNNISLLSSGSASFAGDVASTDGTNIASINNGGTLYVKQATANNSASTPALAVVAGSSTTANIFTDGSAKFASNSASGEDPSLLLTQNNPNGNFLTCKNASTGGNTIQFGVTGTASFAGRTRTNWFTCDSATKNVSASGNAVLTILGDNPGFCTVYIGVKYAANGALQAHYDYELITCDSTNKGGATAIRTMFDGSVGSFQVSASDFAVTRSNSNTIITYTNQAAGSNFITFYVKGNFRSMSIV